MTKNTHSQITTNSPYSISSYSKGHGEQPTQTSSIRSRTHVHDFARVANPQPFVFKCNVCLKTTQSPFVTVTPVPLTQPTDDWIWLAWPTHGRAAHRADQTDTLLCLIQRFVRFFCLNCLSRCHDDALSMLSRRMLRACCYHACATRVFAFFF